MREYLHLCAKSVSKCFTPAPGMDHNQAYAAKGLAVRLAEVAQIRKSLSDLRKDYGRQILLEKGVRHYGFEYILKEPEEDSGVTTWSLLWAGSTKPEDVKLWFTVPRGDVQMHKRDGFELIKDERISLLEEKIDTAKDSWDSKLHLMHYEDLPLEADDDEEWAELFETSFSDHFGWSVENTKLRLVKEYNFFNFRFLRPLTGEVMFDEDLQLETLGGLERRDWLAFVQVERARAESLQFVPMNDADE